jgi:hypothetical protein
MMIFGKRLSEYIAFCRPILILILIVGIVRLALSLGGVSNSIDKWISITVVMWLGLIYYAVRVHTSGFGSYKQLLPICFLQSWTAQLVIIPSIILAIFTGKDNIYSLPEFAFGGDGKTWLHVIGHVVGGGIVGPLIAWLVGCVIMFVTKKVGTRDTEAATRA